MQKVMLEYSHSRYLLWNFLICTYVHNACICTRTQTHLPTTLCTHPTHNVGSTIVTLSTGQVVGITVVVTFIVSVLIGKAVGVGVTYLIVHDKTHKTVDVLTEAPPQQQQPTPGPLYEKVAPAKEEIELKINEAYGPVGQ